MARMTSQELSRISFLVDTLPDFSGVEGVHLGSVPVFDDNGEPLGEINLNDNVFVSYEEA